MKNKRHILIVFIVTLLLLIPLIAMQFTDEVNWAFLDFVIAATLLLGTGLICDLILKKVDKPKFRIALFVAVLLLFLLIWAELAVGIFVSPFNGN